MRALATLRWLALAAAWPLAGCPDPGLTENPLSTPLEGDTVVSVCYAPLVTDEAEMIPVARDGCLAEGVENAELRYWTRNLVFNECPLLKKARRSWFCDAGASGTPPAAPAERPQHELYLPPSPGR